MPKVIAVEDNLQEVKSFLASKGCYVVDASEVNREKVDAFVISGDSDLSSSREAMDKSLVINVNGKTMEELWAEIDS
ncbi:Uncharacterised protein family (UPF0180) [Thermosyntropha lipolytica DSM 11003]|uniref:Uncharacterized protein family (UPF0180) n=1 Tax=Thermosyntropha lipolytica DSM 11003 TaxID=1123382 RepID=A0A1M5RBH6_9FIRM|nr:YkuS family protein [Thermosyntropha lipolytica]SHH23707.1 Uncharacterised protein family (UPF0180) [Thermosyntropha lipolytica DSM 11003]